MNKTTKYVLIGVGILALLGIGLAASAQKRRRAAASNLGQVPLGDVSALPSTNLPPSTTGEAVVAVADKVLGSLSTNPEIQQQRLANRRLRQSTRQAKLLKKGKLRIEDLQALQKV